MSREHSSENQGETSAARQVLEALAAAAKEMTEKFEETAQQAERLNLALETKVNEFFAEITQQTDFLVAKQVAGLHEEKDAIIADLLKLRHEELHAVLSISENLNAAIVEKVDEIFADFKKEAQVHFENYKTSLNKKETDISQSAGLLKMALRDKLGEQLEALHGTVAEEKSELRAVLSRNGKLIKSETEIGLQVLTAQREKLVKRLDLAVSEKTQALETTLASIISRQAENAERQIEEYNKLQAAAQATIKSKLNLEQDLPSVFADMCHESSRMQLSVEEKHFANISLKYKGDVSSIQHDLESKMELAQTHLQNLLKQSVSLYNEKANTLLSGFEKNVKNAKVQSPLTDAENDASIDMLVERLKKELKRSATDTLSEGKTTIEHEFARFRSKLSSESQSSMDILGTHVADALNEAKLISRQQKNMLDDLSRRLNALEQLMDDPTKLDSLFSLLDEDQE
jgi:hypothetical protein